MKIEYPKNFNSDSLKNMFLWRYSDLFKLIDLINTKSLFFIRFDKFEDALEGLTGESIKLKQITNGEPLTYKNINNFDEKTKKKLIEWDQSARMKHTKQTENSQETQFASCWFSGEKESIAMWKTYANSDGFAIKFKAMELIDTIIASAKSYTNSDFSLLYFGPVEYKNLWPLDFKEKIEGKFNGLKKDKSYHHENEFRFVAVTSIENKGKIDYLKLPIGELSSFNIKIIASPYMAKWKFENAKILLSKFGIEDKLQPSVMQIKL